jgi:hypothetical protein
MKLQIAAILLLCAAAEPARAQIIWGPAPPALGFNYQRGRFTVSGYFAPGPFSPGSMIYAGPTTSTTVVVPPPRISITNNYFAGGTSGTSATSPVLGAGYDSDTRGVDLDRYPLKKPLLAESVPAPAPDAPAPPAAPLPGVDVSTPRPTVRPGDRATAKLQPLDLPPPPPAGHLTPAEPFPDARDESAHLIEMGLASFRDGEYGTAAQRFRQAIALDAMSARAYFYLAQAEFAMGDFREAVAVIHAGMKVDRLWPRTPIQLRPELFRGREAVFQEQLKRLMDALALQPTHPLLLFLAGHQSWFDGRRDEAVGIFHKARLVTADRSYIDSFLGAGGAGQVVMR